MFIRYVSYMNGYIKSSIRVLFDLLFDDCKGKNYLSSTTYLFFLITYINFS